MFGRRFLAALVMAGAGLGAGQGFAQEDLNRGKTPAQLYASDCVDCHKNARALGQRDNPGKLADFLRVHYTASRESAAAIAQYLVSLGPEPRSSRPSATAGKPRPAASQEQSKSDQGKPEQGKSEQGKSAPAEEPAKAAEKPAESKPAEAAKPAEPGQEKAAPAPAAPPASEPAPASPAAAPASPPADPQ